MRVEALGRWIVKHERPVPRILILLLGIYSGMGCIGVLIAAIVTKNDGDTKIALILGFVAFILLLLMLPMAMQFRRNRGRIPLQPLIFASSQGKLADRLGESGQVLEEAASDLEQMQTLLPWTTLDLRLQSELKQSADARMLRMLRMLELTIAAPARYGFTRAQADRQFAEDARWMSEVRRLVDKVREAPEQRDDEGSLTDLRALVEAHEEARAELHA